MIEAIKFWNEPNNQSHWDFHIDPGWAQYGEMTRRAARAVGRVAPGVTRVLGGMSPIDPSFLRLMQGYGTLDEIDVVAVHGFPLDWNHWQLDDWPAKIAEIEAETTKPVWVTEVGVSTFGADEVQRFGLARTTELLRDRVDRVFWYSLLDLPQAWGATTRHKESEGSSYYRHFYMGLVRPDGTPKPAVDLFDPALGICQWFHFEDPRFDGAVRWLRRLGVTRLRTGISWADWLRPNALAWFDRQMEALAEFDTTITLCFTPNSRGQRPDHTSPPLEVQEFADFAETVARRYVLGDATAGVTTGYAAGTASAESAPDVVAAARPGDVGALEADEVGAS
jgi:beta-xylosidase